MTIYYNGFRIFHSYVGDSMSRTKRLNDYDAYSNEIIYCERISTLIGCFKKKHF